MGKVKKYAKGKAKHKPTGSTEMEVDDVTERARLKALSLGKLKQAYKVKDKKHREEI